MHAVISRQVARCLRRGDNVISGNRIVQMRHINFRNFGPEFLVYVYRLAQCFLHLLVGAGGKLRHDCYSEFLYRLFELFQVITDRCVCFVNAGAVGRVMAGDDIHHQRSIGDVLCDWPDLVQARTVCYKSVSRNPAVCRF